MKIDTFYEKWNEYYCYLGPMVQPSNDGQFVRMNQVLMKEYEALELVIQIMKEDIYKIYKNEFV